MSLLTQARPAVPTDELTEFLNRARRLPRLGDARAPWQYRGWLLPYVIQLHVVIPAVADRWGYHLRTLDAGKLLDEPIPQITFRRPDNKIISLLQDWSRLIGRDAGVWSDFRTLLDWLCWGLGLMGDAPALSEAVNEKLYRQVNLDPLLQRPYDYLGYYVAQGKSGGWNPTAFFPTPHEVVDLMVRMTMHDGSTGGRDSRVQCVLDPCVGSGRMLLHSSNTSLNLWGQDIDPLAVAMCKINGALYAPWMSFPFPASILDGQVPDPEDFDSTDGLPNYRVDDRQQRSLFD